MQKKILSVLLCSCCLELLAPISFAQSTGEDGGSVDNSGFFINGQIGRVNADVTRTWTYNAAGDKKNERVNFHSGDPGYGVNLGYRWQSLGVEVGYTNLGEFKHNVVSPHQEVGVGKPGVFDVVSPESKVHAYTLGVNGHFNLDDNWYMSGRAGVFRFQTNSPEHKLYPGNTAENNPIKIKANESGWGPYFGIGFGYDFTRNFGIGINYDYFRGRQKERNITVTQATGDSTTTTTASTKLDNGLKLKSGLISLSAEYRFQ